MKGFFDNMKTTLNYKKTALFLLLMAAIGQMQAQEEDIYRGGYYHPDPNNYNRKAAAVFKNNDLLHYYSSPISSINCRVTDIAVDPETGDLYWVLLYATDEFFGDVWCDVYKNSTLYLTLPTMGTMVDNICFSDGHLYMVGSRKVSSHYWENVCWKDNNPTPYLEFNDSEMGFAFHRSNFISVIDGNVYVGTSRGKITKNGVTLYELDPDFSIRGMVYYDGHLYYSGYTWGGSLSRFWRDGQLLYELDPANGFGLADLCVNGGDVYVLYYNPSSQVTIGSKVYKNGQLLYDQWFDNQCMDVVSSGVYMSYLRTLKNNEILYNEAVSPTGDYFCATTMQVVPHCQDNDIRSLPFTESFETAETEWECWTKLDVDNNNGGYASYWDRFGNGVKADADPSPYTGNNCAKHRYLGSHSQTGWLISPRLFLQPNRNNTTLSFWTYEQYPNDYQYEGVWISTTGNSPSNFTEIWTQNNASANWKHVTIDLSAYQGQAVYLAFKYSGQNGHNWYIDNVEVTESEDQCYTEGYLPYTQTFDYEMGPCWYVIDADMSGGQKCWKWDSSNQCVMHPWGQQNTPQEGWLISRPISIWQEEYGYTLSFKSKCSSSGTGQRNSVWISVDKSSSNPPDPADFTEIWVDPDYSSGWTTYNINLTPYAGHNVNIAFKYEGTYAHNWFVDDINIISYYICQITAIADPTEGGVITGAGNYTSGSTCTLTATPNSGYAFVNWTRNGTVVSTNPSYTFTANGDANYVAHFEQVDGCNIVFDLYDNYGDGWGGNKLVVSYGSTTEELTIESGDWAGYTRFIPNGTHVTLSWIAGSYISECHFTVGYEGGDEIYEDEGITSSFSYEFDVDCGGGGAVTQTTNFTNGWNWWSSYVELDANSLTQLQDGLGTNGVTIKSQNDGYNSYLEGLGWYGSLASINNESCYQVKASAPCSVSMTGNEANPTSHSITLNANGWTWIGYPLSTSSSITTALSGFAPQPNDMLKSQNDGYASYLEGYGWYGALSTLNPGMGLMYKSFNSETVTFTYHIGGLKGELKPNQTTDNNHWVPNLTAYADNMSVMAVIELDGEELRGENYELAAFANGECRGSARLIYVAPLDRYIAFLTIAGNEASKLHFGLYDAETGEECFNSSNALTFEPDAVQGSFDSLYVVGFRNTTGVDTHKATLRLYPNPAKNVIRIEGMEPGGEVRIYNSLGVLVKTLNATADREISIGDLASGIYLLRCQNTNLRFVKD